MRLSFRKYFPFVALVGMFLPTALHAQSGIEGTPYTPVFEIQPRGGGDMIESKFRLKQLYDTNLVATPTEQLAGTYSSLEGDITYIHQHPKSILMLTYRGGGNIYPQPQYSNLDAGLNAFHLQLRQNITKRLDMKLTGDWGSIPGGAFAEDSGPPTLGGGDENTDFLARRHITTDASLSLQYQITPHTYLSGGGNFDEVHYEPSTLSSSQSEDGYLAYFYEFTHAQTVSVGIANQWIDFPGTGVHAVVHNLLTTYSNSLTPRLSFTGYVGPAFVSEVVGTSPIPSQSSTSQTKEANIVGGASLKWVAGHTNIVARYDRMFSRGSGLAGTSLRQIAAVSFSQNLSRHLVAAINLNYTTNDLVSFVGENNSSYRILPTFRYHLKSRLTLTGSEGYVHAIGLSGNGAVNRSVTSFGLEFDLPNLTLEK
jgi:hypothetical protein